MTDPDGKKWSLEALLVLGVVMLGGGSVLYVHPQTQVPLHVGALAFAAGAVLRANRYRSKLLATLVSLSAFFAFLGVLRWILPPDDRLTQYGFLWMKIVTVLLVLFYFRTKEISLQRYLWIILIGLAVHSLVGFLLGPLLQPISAPWTDRILTLGGIFYYPLDNDYTRLSGIGGLVFLRNQGLFWEPGVLQVYGNWLFFLAAFVVRSRRVAALATCVVLSTSSTSGIVLLGAQSMVLILSMMKRRRVLVALAALALLAPIGFFVRANIENKILGSARTSWLLRTYDFRNNLRLVEEHPLLGLGVDYEIYRSRLSESVIQSRVASSIVEARDGATNSLLTAFVYGGIGLGLAMLVLLWRQEVFGGPRSVMFSIQVVTLAAEPLLFTLPFLLLVVSGIPWLNLRPVVRGIRQ